MVATRMVARGRQTPELYADDQGVQRLRPMPMGGRINSEGFRGGEFRPDPSRTTVLVLGDSFAFGLSAQPLSESFVDRVERAGYRVFNTGVPGTGPTQYAAVAEKWVPRLRPDVTVVMFYMGNDIVRDPILPGKPLLHPGGIMAFDGDRWLGSPEEAQRYWAEKSNAFAQPPEGRWKRYLGTSVIGTRLWVLAHPEATRPRTFHDRTLSPEKIAFVRDCLERIRSVASNNGSRFLLFVIPANGGPVSGLKAVQAQRAVFEGFDPRVPDFPLTASDYSKTNLHFNNEGHRKYADFILRHLPAANGARR